LNNSNTISNNNSSTSNLNSSNNESKMITQPKGIRPDSLIKIHKDYYLVKTSRDGNCFFDCLSIGVFNKTVSVANLRERVSKYYESNKKEYKDFIQEKEE